MTFSSSFSTFQPPGANSDLKELLNDPGFYQKYYDCLQGENL